MAERNDYIDAMRYAYGIDTDDISEINRLAGPLGQNMYPFKAARGNCKSFYSSRLWAECLRLKIEKVIFNEPATIVLWSDGTKTVVKCDESETFDHEKGLAMAIAKRFLRTNTTGSNYYDEFKKWLPKKEPKTATITVTGTLYTDGTGTLYTDGLPILEAKIDKDLEEMNKEVSERIQNLCKIAKENLERKNGKHFKDN